MKMFDNNIALLQMRVQMDLDKMREFERMPVANVQQQQQMMAQLMGGGW